MTIVMGFFAQKTAGFFKNIEKYNYWWYDRSGEFVERR
ncbi:hypothetical protein B4109_0580 [Geobacillus stearothermophilus]|uniref:Uncharacterized protein n=1 Tax=Geobacillus stearothermophilus TaxID=1422 RepID=A0A150MRT9_GEOSE|nr:hypothetical protein B4109_0580 [Geobacillus stearothermophilus]